MKREEILSGLRALVFIINRAEVLKNIDNSVLIT